jgi:RNA polymerase sigma factor (sigma-70 family)
MTDDAELLRRYAEEASQEAFAELVGRHLGLVFHAALRQCGGDQHRAEDVAQLVFTDLACKAGSLARRPVLAGWLYTSTRYAAAQAVRTEARRQVREREAAVTEELLADPGPLANWARLRPVIDETLQALGETEREAVLLRFFEGQPFAEIGARLALSEDAARMRVERALEKMRDGLARHGVTSTAAALAAALATQATAAVPAGLAASITGAALGGATAATATIVFMTMTKLQVGLALALAAAGTAGLVWQHQANTRLQAEVAAMRTEVAENTRLRAENETLARQAAAAVTVRPGQVSATKSSGETAGTTGRRPGPAAQKPYSGVPLAAGLSPVESLGNAGRATPRAAFATQLWAARTGNSELEATAITFGPEARAKLVALAAELPVSLTSEYDTPEKLMAFILAGSHHPVGGMQVLGETTQSDDDVTLQTQWQHVDDDIVHQSDIQFHRADDGWKMVVPVVLVDRAAAYLTRGAAKPLGK